MVAMPEESPSLVTPEEIHSELRTFIDKNEAERLEARSALLYRMIKAVNDVEYDDSFVWLVKSAEEPDGNRPKMSKMLMNYDEHPTVEAINELHERITNSFERTELIRLHHAAAVVVHVAQL